MFPFRLKFSWSSFLVLAAAAVCTVEVCATSYRGHSFLNREQTAVMIAPPSSRSVEGDSIIVGTLSGSASSSTVLVLGNPGPATGECTVTLRSIPVSQVDVESRGRHVTHRVTTRWSESTPPQSPLKASSTHAPQRERAYFLPSSIQSAEGQSAHSAVPCRLDRVNARTLIYVDQRIPCDDTLVDLVDAIDSASMSTMIETVERLVGSVADIDCDGHLTIVITPDVGRLGLQSKPVYGITRPSDFIRGVDRPEGNQSDVIFLNSSLQIGQQLHAVLCHEWCHAAVFSRRFENADGVANGRFDDDWLNEAIAHVVEVAASGSDSNIASRVQNYWAEPGNSPLVIRDYCSPAYWRNERVRGAGYLFLDWYLKHTDDGGLIRLLGMPSLDVAGLEADSHRRFDDLFRSWTVSLGEQLATAIRHQAMHSAAAPRMTHHQWKLNAGQEQLLTLRIGGSCADFVQIECPSGSTWQLIATTPAAEQIQATLVPVSNP